MRRLPSKRKIILGITGSFGSGKSTVARIFKSFGAQVIDADKIAHGCILFGTKTYKRIIRLFGKDILQKKGIINRRKLAEIVFNNKNLLKKLNNIIHPEVIRIIRSQIKLSKARIVVLDAPLLIEAKLKGLVDKLIVVKINRVKQVKRIQGKTSLSSTDILKRVRSQIPLREKARLADFIIDNNGPIRETRKQVERIRRLLWKS